MSQKAASSIPETRSIIICCNSFPPEKGGAPGRIKNMAVLLRNAGYRVIIITAMPNYPAGRIFPGYRGKLFNSELVDGLDVLRTGLIPSNSGNLFVRGLSLLSFLLGILLIAGPRLVFKRANLVIVSSPPLLSAWLSALLAKWGRKKILVNISDIWPLTAVEMGAMKKGFFFRLLRKIELHLYGMSDAMMGQSQEIIDHLSVLKNKDKALLRYRNLQDEKPGSIQKDASYEGGIFKIIYAGNLGHAQGMARLCRTINFRVLNSELHIYGAGADEEMLRQYLAANPSCGIVLHEAIAQDQLDLLLEDFQAMLIPLKQPIYGAVPSKLFMAVAAGIPVLFCGGGEGGVLVSSHHLGVVSPPGDYVALQEAIHTLATANQEAREKMLASIAKARRYTFSKKEQDKKFLDFVEHLVSTP